MLHYKKQKSKKLNLTSEDLEKTKMLNNLINSELLYESSFIIIVIFVVFTWSGKDHKVKRANVSAPMLPMIEIRLKEIK